VSAPISFSTKVMQEITLISIVAPFSRRCETRPGKCRNSLNVAVIVNHSLLDQTTIELYDVSLTLCSQITAANVERIDWVLPLEPKINLDLARPE